MEHKTDRPVKALRQRAAEEYIGMKPGWLDNSPIPWVDMRKPGAAYAVRVFLIEVLDAFLAARTVMPGFPNPQETR